MPGIIPEFINVTTSEIIEAGWKNIAIIPTGNVVLTNTLNPAQSMTINSPFMIGNADADYWEGITVTGTAIVILNGSAQVE